MSNAIKPREIELTNRLKQAIKDSIDYANKLNTELDKNENKERTEWGMAIVGSLNLSKRQVEILEKEKPEDD